MDESIDTVSRGFTETLRGVLRGEVDLLAVCLWGRAPMEAIRPLCEHVVTSKQYGGPVYCLPWKWRLDRQMMAPTANEVSAMLVAELRQELLPDAPHFTNPTFVKTLDEYIGKNEAAIDCEFARVCRSLKESEWNRVITLAEIERTLFTRQKTAVSQKESGPWRATKGIREHLGTKGIPLPNTTWQRQRRELGDEIIDHPTSGAQKVRFTRVAAETLHINTTGIKFQPLDMSPESDQ